MYQTIKYENGDVYEGNLIDDVRQGFGKYTFVSGASYEGEWENGKYNGKGVFTYAVNDKFNRKDYVGIWLLGEKVAGKLTWKNGEYFDGSFNNDYRWRGINYNPNGTVYSGSWAFDRRQGYGELKNNDGSGYQGFWYNNVRYGIGQSLDVDGKVYQKGLYVNDEFKGNKWRIYCTSFIENNPFRIANSYTNTAVKDILASINRMKMFLKVNRTEHIDPEPIFFHGMKQVERTQESLSEIAGIISNPMERIKYSLFWFSDESSFDKIALKHLEENCAGKAIKIWESNEDSCSALLNLSVYYLYNNRYDLALNFLQTINSPFDSDNEMAVKLIDYINAKGDLTTRLSALQVEDIYINTLCDIAPDVDWYSLIVNEVDFTESRKAYLKEKISNNFLKRIQKSIEEHNAKETGYSIDDLQSLKSEVEVPMEQLKCILGANDIQIKIITGKLCECYNDICLSMFKASIDHETAIDLIYFLKYVKTIAITEEDKRLCDVGISEINKVLLYLPPRRIKVYDDKINMAIILAKMRGHTCKTGHILLEKCIDDLSMIRKSMGESDEYYLNISTQVADNILNFLVEEVNEQNKSNTNPISFALLRDAWILILDVGLLDLDKLFRDKRLAENKSILKRMLAENRVSVNSIFPDIDNRSEAELFENCKTIYDCDYYLRKFPAGEHLLQVQEKRMKLVTGNPFVDRGTKQNRTQNGEKKYTLFDGVKSYPAMSKNAVFENNNINPLIVIPLLSFVIALVLICLSYTKASSWPFGVSIVFFIFNVIISSALIEKKSKNAKFFVIASVIMLLCAIFGMITSFPKKTISSGQTQNTSVNSVAVVDSAAVSPSDSTTVDSVAPEVSDYTGNSLPTGSKPYKGYYGSSNVKRQCYIQVAASSESDVIVLVKKNNSLGRVVNHAYIKAGESFKLYIHPGTYQVFFYFGNDWNPYKNVGKVMGGFESNAYVEKDEPITINEFQYLKYSLQKSQYGNLHAEDSDEDEAFQ